MKPCFLRVIRVRSFDLEALGLESFRERVLHGLLGRPAGLVGGKAQIAAGDEAPPAPTWDESRASSGELRPHWQTLMATIGRLGREEFALRIENGRRILREHGVSCFSASAGGERDVPWELDFVPFVLPATEWRELEAGLVQRARLLNLVLDDLHGVQRLVRDGFVPAPLIFANPAYLRACQGVRVPGGNYLQLYAADLARGPDGRWRVLSDRTQAPAGLGFALENRSLLARVLPEAVCALRPCSLSETLRVRRDTLRRLAPAGVENPAIALLTPGPRNEAYFEHAYLARLLGFTLVEGGDLTVRDRRVLLKTLEGLRPVDVLLRRVADGFCDPLALRGDSLLGVPGLVEATRAGNVAVANALGSGLVESPAFLPFLPGLALHLLGEELKLPSVATWWCGQVRERRHVEAWLDQLYLRPAFTAGGPQAQPNSLTAAEREAWVARLREQPHEFVAQEQVMLSRAPVADGRTRPMVLRCYVLLDGQEHVAMPGGLARMMDTAALGSITLPLIGGAKDVWVLPEAGELAEPPHVVAPPPPVLERLASDLPSRSAENLFWLGRYAERLELLLRLTRCAMNSLLGEAVEGRPTALAALLAGLELTDPEGTPDTQSAELQQKLLALLYEPAVPVGVRALLKRIHIASFNVRDRLSADTWRILSRLGADAGERPGHLPLVFASAAVSTLVLDLAAFAGMEMENMTRGHGWVFLDLGRRIERGLGLAQLVASALRSAGSRELLLEPLLEIADSVITYRRRYFAEPRTAGVLDLLLLDPTNPRALAFQLAVMERHAAGLPAGPNPEGVAQLRQRIAQLGECLDWIRAEELDTPDRINETADWLTGLASSMGAVSDLLTHVYFSQVLPRVS
jgi:uncharacterized circularly permuted ATP-grasp superfamily protein/uncharacterized alpha-E superfamily protein